MKVKWYLVQRPSSRSTARGGAARARGLSDAELLQGDLAALPELGPVDGIWCSFAAAYFVELVPVLASWSKALRPSGWIMLTEVDDLFGHEPLSARTKALFEAYVQDAFEARRYDFRMGRRPGAEL